MHGIEERVPHSPPGCGVTTLSSFLLPQTSASVLSQPLCLLTALPGMFSQHHLPRPAHSSPPSLNVSSS